MDDISRAYVMLAHRIQAHIPDYIDGYFGPDLPAEEDAVPPEVLADEAEALAEEVAALEDEGRRSWLGAQVESMKSSIALLRGEEMSLTEEVRRIYQAEAEYVPESQFEEHIAQIDDLLPGKGTLHEREQAFRDRFSVDRGALAEIAGIVIDELRARARSLWELPEEESFDLQLVNDEHWMAYNWYMGMYRSRIELNTDFPTPLTDLPDLMAHEGYPGHHTEHVIKEQLLYRGQGRGEHSIILLISPESVISEGIAMRALRQVMSDEEVKEWLSGDLARRAGIAPDEISRMLLLQEIKEKLSGVMGNAALLLFEKGWSEEDVADYIRQYNVVSREKAEALVGFITHPNSASYVFTYTEGAALLDRLFAKGDAHKWFTRALREPVTPGMLREWANSA